MDSQLHAEGSSLGLLGAHLIFAVCDANRLIGRESIGIANL